MTAPTQQQDDRKRRLGFFFLFTFALSVVFAFGMQTLQQAAIAFDYAYGVAWDDAPAAEVAPAPEIPAELLADPIFQMGLAQGQALCSLH